MYVSLERDITLQNQPEFPGIFRVQLVAKNIVLGSPGTHFMHMRGKLGVTPGNDKVSLRMSDLKPLNARGIVEMYDYLKHQKGLMLSGFYKVGITGSVKSENEVFARIENTCKETRALQIFFV